MRIERGNRVATRGTNPKATWHLISISALQWPVV